MAECCASPSSSHLPQSPLPLLPKPRDEDILVPITVGMHRWQHLVYFPPDKKIDRAVFRGRGEQHMEQSRTTCCGRTSPTSPYGQLKLFFISLIFKIL